MLESNAPTPTVFLSTLSLRRATPHPITIFIRIIDFYPRSPCGERPVMYDIVLMPWKFLSTLSLRRATGSRIYDMSAA